MSIQIGKSLSDPRTTELEAEQLRVQFQIIKEAVFRFRAPTFGYAIVFDKLRVFDNGTFGQMRKFTVSSKFSPFKAPRKSSTVELECKPSRAALNPPAHFYFSLKAANGTRLTTDFDNPLIRGCDEQVRMKLRIYNPIG